MQTSDVKKHVDGQTDPLLFDSKFKDTTPNGFINIFRILSRQRKSKRPLTTYYHLDNRCKDRILGRLLEKFRTLDNAAKAIVTHNERNKGKRYASKIKEKWRVKNNLQNGNVTIWHARVVSLVLAKNHAEAVEIFEELFSNSRFLVAKGKEIRCPHKISELGPAGAYLAGVVAGDGHITKSLDEIKIVDGHQNKRWKKDTFLFLKSIDGLIKEKFGLTAFVEEKDNYLVFRYASTLLCSILNHVYEIPAGRKSKKIRIPKIVKNGPHEHLFWRGIVDTDGSIRKGSKLIRMTTTSKQLFLDFLDFCKRHNIHTFSRKNKFAAYGVVVAEESIANFARIVGSNHPRKRANLIEYLKKGASYKVPVSKKPNERLNKIIAYLRPYQGNVYVRLTSRREAVGEEVVERLKNIEKVVGMRLVEVKRPRKNNHFYICSRELLNEINECYEFKHVWSPLSDEEINRMKIRWDRYE